MTSSPHQNANLTKAVGPNNGHTDKPNPSPYEAVAQAWRTLDEDDALLLSGLTKEDVKRLRRLLYKRFGKINVLVRSVRQDDGTYKAVVRAREGREYLWGKSK
jgi:hypothetical protein